MSGGYRRAIVVRAGPGVAAGEMEDDFQHFAVWVRHDGAQVTAVDGRAIRHPWSLCPMAATALAELAGHPLDAHPADIYRRVDPLDQCTHMLETAGLAIAQAARGFGARRYDVRVDDPVAGRAMAELRRDGEPLACWTLQDGAVVEPQAFAGLAATNIRSAALTGLAPADAEAALVLRRAVILAAARGLDIDRYPTAAAMDRGRACFVFRPGVAEHAQRRPDSVRDFSNGPGPLAGA